MFFTHSRYFTQWLISKTLRLILRHQDPLGYLIYIYIYIYIFAPRSLPGCCCWRPALHVGAMVAMPQLRQPPWPWPWPCGWAWLAFSSDRQASPVPKPKTSRRQVFSGFTTSLHFASLSSELHVLFALLDSMRIYIYIFVSVFFLRHADKGNQQAMFSSELLRKTQS